MAILRRPDLPRVIVPLIGGTDTLYEVDLTAVPSPPWRAAFLRPPAKLISATFTPDIGRLALWGATVSFRTTPDRLDDWLRRIDRWIAYANSLIEE